MRALWLVALLGCRWDAPYVVVSVEGDGVPSNLSVTAALATRSDSFALAANKLPFDFSLQLPPDAKGRLQVSIQAIVSNANVSNENVSGENNLDVDGNGQYSLTVTLGAAALDLALSGNGNDAAPPASDAAEAPTEWVAQTVSAPALLNVWGTGGEVWAVGYQETILHTSDRGAQWNNIGPGGASDLVNVWGADPVHVVAVGLLPPVILYSTGSSFSAATLPSPYNASGQKFLGVWGSDAGDAWAVGTGGAILHSTDLVHWTAQASGVSNDLFSVWGAGPKDVFAAGTGVVLHSTDGSSWSKVSGVSASLTNIWGSGPGNIVAVGGSGMVLRSSNDGASFSPLSVNGATLPFDGDWGVGAELFVISGDDSFLSGSIWHSSDYGAHFVEEGAPAGSTAALYGIWGSAYDDVYAVGASGAGAGFVYHRQRP